jgi:hypothetical protein
MYSRRASSSGFTQRLDWVRGHDIPCLRHPSLTTSISRQTRAPWSCGLSLAVLYWKSACCLLHLSSDAHFGADSSRPVRRYASLVRWHAPSLWSITVGHNLMRDSFRSGVSSAVMCPSSGPPEASSSPLGTYSSAVGHHITPHNLTSPLNLPLSTYILVEHPPP